MRTVIVIDPNAKTPIAGLHAQTEPQEGEPAKLVTVRMEPIKGGTVKNVRANTNWPGHFLYDVWVDK